MGGNFWIGGIFLGLKTGGWWGGWHYSGDREGGGGCYAIATAASGATGHFPPTPSHLLRLFTIWLLSLVKILNIVIFFWRACLSLGHGQVDREHSLQFGLSVTFPKVQVANNAVNESKHKGNKKKSEFWD